MGWKKNFTCLEFCVYNLTDNLYPFPESCNPLQVSPMIQLAKKQLYAITAQNLAPPYLDYEYFRNSTELPFCYNADRFDIVNAWWLIESATLAYAPPQFAVEKFTRNAGFKDVAFFDTKTTQCYVVSTDKFAIVAFRGSEARLREGNPDPGHIFADWLANFNVLLEPWEPDGHVHRGFKAAFDEVWPQLQPCILSLQQGNRKIWMTGHSQGAALATLAASRHSGTQGLYTYGSPRVGDRAFKQGFKTAAYRFVNHHDIVARVPPAAIYRHVGQLRYIDANGMIHSHISHLEKWAGMLRSQLENIANIRDQLPKNAAKEFAKLIVDHVPVLYAIHIWNQLVDMRHLHYS